MPDIHLKRLEARHFVGMRRTLPVTDLGPFFAEALPATMGWLAAKGIAPASRPMAVWVSMDMEAGIAVCHAGCFVAEAVQAEGEMTPGETTAGEALVVTHVGPYPTVGRSWMALYARAKELGRAPGSGWEIYESDPGDTPAAELRTRIHLPLS